MRVLTDPLGWFTLEVPEGWRMRSEDAVTVLTGPGEVGTLFLAGGRHAGGRQSSFGRADFLARFLAHVGVGCDLAAIESWVGPGCLVFRLVREDARVHWRYYSVTDDETALLVSYTCPAGRAGAEGEAVDAMVRSVRLYRSSPAQ